MNLKRVISGIKGIEPENIFLGNGSDEIIDICFRTFCEPGMDKALTFVPTYGMYAVSASVNNVEMINVPLNESFNINVESLEPYIDDKKVKLIFICSPNNPSGNVMRPEVMETIIGNFNGIVVVDEAYIDFSGSPSLGKNFTDIPIWLLCKHLARRLDWHLLEWAWHSQVKILLVISIR